MGKSVACDTYLGVKYQTIDYFVLVKVSPNFQKVFKANYRALIGFIELVTDCLR